MAMSASLGQVQGHGNVSVVDEALIRPNLKPEPQKDLVQKRGQVEDDDKYEKKLRDFPTLDGKTMDDSDSDSKDTKREPGQKVRDTLAKKVARANLMSTVDGPLDDEEFPSLGGTGKTKNGTQSTVWKKGDFPTLGGGTRQGKPQPRGPVHSQPHPSQPPHVSQHPCSSQPPHPSQSQPPKPRSSQPQHPSQSRPSQSQPSSRQSTRVKTQNMNDFPSLSNISSTLLSSSSSGSTFNAHKHQTASLLSGFSPSNAAPANVSIIKSKPTPTDLAPTQTAAGLTASPKTSAKNVNKSLDFGRDFPILGDFPTLSGPPGANSKPQWGPRAKPDLPQEKPTQAQGFMKIKLKNKNKNKKPMQVEASVVRNNRLLLSDSDDDKKETDYDSDKTSPRDEKMSLKQEKATRVSSQKHSKANKKNKKEPKQEVSEKKEEEKSVEKEVKEKENVKMSKKEKSKKREEAKKKEETINVKSEPKKEKSSADTMFSTSEPSKKNDIKSKVSTPEPSKKNDTKSKVSIPEPSKKSDTKSKVSTPEASKKSDTKPKVSITEPSKKSDTKPKVSILEPNKNSDTKPKVSTPVPSKKSDTKPKVSTSEPSKKSDTKPNVSTPVPSKKSDTKPNDSTPEPSKKSDTKPKVSTPEPCKKSDTKSKARKNQEAKQVDVKPKQKDIDIKTFLAKVKEGSNRVPKAEVKVSEPQQVLNDFPSLSSLSDQLNPKLILDDFTSYAKLAEQHKDKAVLDDYTSLSALKDQSNLPNKPAPAFMDDFPMLSLSNPAPTVSAVPLPPGFKAAPTSKAPPPGFCSWVDPSVVPTKHATASKPPPGFSVPSSGVEPTVSASGSTTNNEAENVAPSDDSFSYSYNQPHDFQNRNQCLLEAIQKLTNASEDAFHRFKSCSGHFRQDKMSAREYYTECGDIIGMSNFLEIFPELIALLPDLNKQQELLTAHTETQKKRRGNKKGKKSAWGAGDVGFKTCTICGQVLVEKDFKFHAETHNLDSDFPILGGPATTNASVLRAWVRAK